MPLTPSSRLGPYEIVAPLGAGGMGEVYRARDTRLDRTVAIKILPSHLAGREDLRQRFEREARAVSSLNHPHICTLHDIGSQDGVDYLVMEYLEGETLAARLEKGPLALPQALEFARQIAQALDAAHRRGVVHRDLKPGNIMLTKSGAKLLDFGLAKLGAGKSRLAGETVTQGLTSTGTILGTFQYMAPEQLEGKEAEAASDIFSFGAVLYEMVTGRKAFEAKSQASLIAAILDRDPPPLAEFSQSAAPPALDHLIRKCLAKHPEERWQSAHDIALEVKWIAEEPAVAVAQLAPEAKRAGLVWKIAAAVSLLAAVGFAWLWLSRPAPRAWPVRFEFSLPEKVRLTGASTMDLSPDGRVLAFTAAERDKAPQIWLRPLDSLVTRLLAGTEGAEYPFWSPDGRFVAFSTSQRLKKVEVSTGAVTVLCNATGGFGGSWNRDGVIVFAPHPEGALDRVSADGGSSVPVTVLDPAHEETVHAWPRFLPDWRHYFFFVFGRDNTGIYAGTLGSNERRRVLALGSIADASITTYVEPGYLLYVRQGALVAQRFHARNLSPAGEPVHLVEGVQTGGPGRALYAVAGGVLAYHTGTVADNSQLTWMDRQGRPIGAVGSPEGNTTVALSRDGRFVATSRPDPEHQQAIWLYDLDRGSSSKVPSDWYASLPVWAPDGNSLVFSSARDTPPNLYRKSLGASGQDERRMRSSLQSFASDWSADGRFIAYGTVHPQTRADIWILPLTGDRKPTPFLTTPAYEHSARFSPDVHWIAYVSNESGRPEVYVTSFPTPGRKTQVSTGGGVQPHWRRDGKELFYLARDNKLMAVEVKAGAAFEAGVPKPLFEVKSAYDVAADGGRFLVNVPLAEQPAQHITVVLNWSAGLKP